MLVGIMYVLVPMPYLFFGASGGDSYTIGSTIQSGCGVRRRPGTLRLTRLCHSHWPAALGSRTQLAATCHAAR
jgi:hypothetical protein